MRVYNFSAGPAMLPEPVLAQAQAELLDWNGSGMSVMEVSHRSKEFVACAAEAERKMMEASALLVVGSSVMVYSSFRLCRMAAETDKPVAAINLGKTRADHLLAFKTEAPAQDILPAIAAMLG